MRDRSSPRILPPVDASEARQAAQRLRPVAVAWARSYNYADAEDIAHDALAAMLEHADRIPPAAAYSWLRTAVLHKAREARRQRREVLTDVPPPIDPDPGPEDTLASAQIGAAVQAAMERIAESRRTILAAVAEGRSQADVAAEQGVPESTVRVRARDGAEELRADLHRQRVAEKRRSGSTSWMAMLGWERVEPKLRAMSVRGLSAFGAIIAGGLLLIPEDVETLGATPDEAPVRVAIVEPLMQPATASAERGVEVPEVVARPRARHDAGRRWRAARW